MRDEAHSLTDTLDARAGLEAACARLAASNRDESDLTHMEDALERRFLAHDALEIEAYVAADAEFHHAVIGASHNPILIRLHSAVAHLMDSSIARTSGLPEDPAVGQLHRELLAAIRGRDADLANALAYQMIASVKPDSAE